MGNLQKFKLICAIAMAASAASASDLIIDNQVIPGSDIESISISPVSGNLFINTTPGYTVTRDIAGITVTIDSFSISPGTIIAGNSTTVSWSASNAVSCTQSNGVGSWGGVVGASGSQQITTSTLGTHTFTLTCNGSEAGDTATSNRTLTVNSAAVVSVNSFTASPGVITEGESTTISWNVENATGCVPSGGTGGWNTTNITLPTGSTQITVASAGSYTFTLSCQNGQGGSDSATTSVTADPLGVACKTPPLSGSTAQWSSFWGYNFPSPRYANKNAILSRSGYFAIRFNTGNVVDHGAITTIETTTTDGVRLGAISECPGDFDVASKCKHVWGIGGSVQWATDSYSNACQLKPNTDYYFNVTYTDGFNPDSTSCARYPCYMTIQAVNY